VKAHRHDRRAGRAHLVQNLGDDIAAPYPKRLALTVEHGLEAGGAGGGDGVRKLCRLVGTHGLDRDEPEICL